MSYTTARTPPTQSRQNLRVSCASSDIFALFERSPTPSSQKIMSDTAASYGHKHPDIVLALKQQIGRLPSSAVQPPGKQLCDFIASSQSLREMERLRGSFNLFEGLEVQAAEVRHSRLLAWLFDPGASHGHTILYLKRFLGLTGETAPSLFDAPTDWKVTCEDQRIDILLTNVRARFVCAIETKIHAAQGPGQLARYRELLASRYPSYERRFVYLTLGQEKPVDPTWQALSLRKMVQEVIPEGKIVGSDVLLRSLLFREYADWIKAKAKPGAGNLFTIMHLAGHELKHSNFLAWLLDPRGSHNLGGTFVRYFFGLLGSRVGRDLSPLINACNDLQVEREFEHIDLLLLSEGCRFGVVIENKVNAKERFGQVADYEAFVKRQFGWDETFIVYLDMQGRASHHGEAVNLSYRDLLPFFDHPSIDPQISESDRIATFVDQYRKLLNGKLWMRANSRRLPPPALEALAARTAQQHRTFTTAILREVWDWRQATSIALGEFLASSAKEIFGCAIQQHWPRGLLHWYTFVPSELDSLALLRRSGSNGPYQGRLVVYEFYVNLFAEKFEGRPAQLSLDVKIHGAKPGAEALKQFLHDQAVDTPLFHRANELRSPRKHDILLNHRLLQPAELEFRSMEEIKRILRGRLLRFRETVQPSIHNFFRRALEVYEATQL